MVEKHARSRSKSATRRRSTRSLHKNKPVVVLTKMSVENDSLNQSEILISKHEVKEIVTISKLEGEFISKEESYVNSEVLQTEINSDNINNFKTEKLHEEHHSRTETNILIFILILVFIPLVLFLNKMCENSGKLQYVEFSEIKLHYFVNLKNIGIILGWLLFLGVLANIPIGKVVKMKSSHGFDRKFRCNGFLSLLISVIILLTLLYTNNLPVKYFFDNYYFFIGSSTTVAFIISFLLTLKYYLSTKPKFSFRPGSVLNTFMFGRHTNQSLFGLDLKFFYEVRPGYTSWIVINLLLCFQDWQSTDFRSINVVLALSATAQIIYCIDALSYESDLITKSFIENSQFGFFHCFGNQVLVPFFFTLTSRTIQINKYEMPCYYLGGVALLNFCGYIIYRSSNIQKTSFRSNPYSVHLSHLKTFTNQHGHQLLAGGWWGWVRHPNYFGELLMIFSWTLYAGPNIFQFSEALDNLVGLPLFALIQRYCRHTTSWLPYHSVTMPNPAKRKSSAHHLLDFPNFLLDSPFRSLHSRRKGILERAWSYLGGISELCSI